MMNRFQTLLTISTCGATPCGLRARTLQVALSGGERSDVLLQRRVRGRGPIEGLQSVPSVQDGPVLLRRVSDAGLECGWAQGDVWHILQ